jgi:hypothetical protein
MVGEDGIVGELGERYSGKRNDNGKRGRMDRKSEWEEEKTGGEKNGKRKEWERGEWEEGRTEQNEGSWERISGRDKENRERVMERQWEKGEGGIMPVVNESYI